MTFSRMKTTGAQAVSWHALKVVNTRFVRFSLDHAAYDFLHFRPICYFFYSCQRTIYLGFSSK
jgi:hypothetical protein